MDSRNLVISIVTCDLPEADGLVERPLFTGIRGTFIVRGEVQSKFENLDCTRTFGYLDIDWYALYTLWATLDSSAPAIAGVDTNPISWLTFGNTYGGHTPPDAFVVWSLHA